MAQAQMNVLPLTIAPLGGEQEQRATQRALTYWNKLRGARPSPQFADFRYVEDSPWNADLFILKQDSFTEHSVFILCGERVSLLFGGRPIRRTLAEVVPRPLQRQMTEDCDRAIDSCGPAGSEGWYAEPSGEKVFYRYVFLPLEASVSRLGYVFGAYSSTTGAVAECAARRPEAAIGASNLRGAC